MAKFNFNLRNPGKLSNCPIYLIIRYQNQKLVYPTGERIPPEFWNKTAQRVKVSKSFPEAPYLNERLDYIAREAKTTYRKFGLDNNHRTPSISELRRELDLVLREKSSLSGLGFYEFIEKFIAEAYWKNQAT